ncbi:Hypothetical predicted protein, partial [Pelobates cultripes]
QRPQLAVEEINLGRRPVCQEEPFSPFSSLSLGKFPGIPPMTVLIYAMNSMYWSVAHKFAPSY